MATVVGVDKSWIGAALVQETRSGGDVRSGSVKRVASAVGEGAMAVQFVHEYLKEMGAPSQCLGRRGVLKKAAFPTILPSADFLTLRVASRRQAMISWTTWPWTSVRRKSRPWKRKVSFV
jgi:hypothetical protein